VPEKDAAFRYLRADPNASMRLFCFPYAGVGPSVFKEWPPLVVSGTELVGIEYPGREARSAESAATTVHQLVDCLLPALLPLLNKPFAFFGHSMGALVAYELTRIIARQSDLCPELFVVSGAPAPHCPQPRPIHQLPNKEFLRAVLQLNGMPTEVLRDRELLDSAVTTLRTDFTLCETYECVENAPLMCPIMVFGGEADPRVDHQGLEGWRDHAAGAFMLNIVPGDHFFVQGQRHRVINTINRELTKLIQVLSYV